MKRASKKIYTFILLSWDIISMILTLFFIRSLSTPVFSNLIEPINNSYIDNFLYFNLCCIGTIVVFNIIFKCYNSVWRFASTGEAAKIALSTFSFILLLKVVDIIFIGGLPIGIVVIIGVLQYVLMLIGRMSVRIVRSYKGNISLFFLKDDMKKVIIYGAGDAGSFYLHKTRENPENNLYPVAFIDDNPALWGRKISGVKVEGGIEKLEDTIDKYGAEEIIISITNLKSKLVKNVLNICKDKYCAVKKYALTEDINVTDQNVEKVPLSQLAVRPINLEELLRRDSVDLNMDTVVNFVENKTVFVTGGAGSIGSEI
ncbi:MAG: hypothetical protein RR483_04300, partial [Clostridia bacterium]